MRLIFHLSHPRGTNKSVNVNTPREKCIVKYPDFAEAIQICARLGKSCKLSHSDVRSTFRNLCLRKVDWCYLIMMAESPFDGEKYYFVDKCLPFGASISCAHFQAVSDSLAHIMRVKTRSDNVNYLDDFLFVAMMKALCDGHITLFLLICKRIGMPISIEKTFWSSTQMTFLGFLIDTVRQIILIPVDKLNKAIDLINKVLAKDSKKLTLKQLQQICGYLNFLGRCIIPGRAFTRRLYAYINNKLKPHHHIRINSEMRRDLEMWRMFLTDQSAYARGFMDFAADTNAKEISMFSDASRSEILGMGVICQNSWTFVKWPENYIKKLEPSIEYLELYALVIGVSLWIQRFQNRRIVLFCDNQAVVHMVNNTTSSCKNCMVLIRKLVLKSLQHNVRVFAKYIKSSENKASDYLSRMKFKKFFELKNSWEAEKTELPTDLWPIENLWLN